MMRKSKYCICPSGYEVASPRMVEALYTGCVPVLIKDHYVPPFSDVFNWKAFSVEIPNMKNILMGISSRQYIRMQRRGVTARRHFEVNLRPKRYNGYVLGSVGSDVVLERVNASRLYGYFEIVFKRQRHRNFARQHAARFAIFMPEQELGNDGAAAPDGGVEDWPGPVSTAVKIMKDRGANKTRARYGASKNGPKWIPKKQEESSRCDRHIPSLQELCLSILCENADAISSLEELTDLSLEVIGGTCSELRAVDLSSLRKLTDVSMGHLANGFCNLCNGGVKFVRENDRQRNIRFEALQSEAGKKLLQRSGKAPDDISSVVLVEKDRFVRDFVYENIADNRYNLFGRTDSCEI
ncbi:probable glycosyltransferase at5g03795 [Phtheirospermum japonicum]|uniref:Probable glycosyltransferase at5g03795 n=1 Tax=Phtheirospermum japonicum TaxID=374723 RepID=A0A830D5G3_9LAMI|nr:probable glycosyltransferase at5g03795 [Phtheirospermum japonicum]